MISSQSFGAARAGNPLYTAPRRLYLDKEGRVVEANDPTRVELLCPAGQTMPLYRAQALGLAEVAPVQVQNGALEPLTPESNAPKMRTK